MRAELSMLAVAMTANTCAAFVPSPSLHPSPSLALPSRLAASRLQLAVAMSPEKAIRAPTSGLRVAHASAATRLCSSAEVAVSKIFPACAGWQAASLVAGKAGLASNSLAFFLTVGMGDLIGVFMGHTLYQRLKKKATNNTSIRMNEQVQIATLLGGAVLFSGSMWQPALNTDNALGLGFNGAFSVVCVACTFAFFAGLRVWRKILSPSMAAVERNSYPNLKADVQLSIAIGAATAFFVGTDVSFGAANWLAGIVGIIDTMFNLVSICVAGCSTTLGFMACQLAMTGLPKNKCWIDPVPQFSQ